MQPEDNFFKELGFRIRQLRRKAGYSQEDMISYGFSVRYWQKIEAGKPITLRTLIRICRLFSAQMHDLVRGLDVGGAGESMVIQKGSRRKKKSGE